MTEMTKPFLIVIVGPTASGKTELSIEVAKKFNGEIISGDSMQVYQGMDIGTAKVTTEEMEGIPHYMIDILPPDASFSAYEFKKRAEKYIKDISDELEEGQEVDVKVLSIADDGKIGLSIRKTKQAQQASDDKPKVEKPKKEAPKQKSQDFDSMMNSFLKDSEDRLSSLKQQTENRRGGRGGHRN